MASNEDLKVFSDEEELKCLMIKMVNKVRSKDEKAAIVNIVNKYDIMMMVETLFVTFISEEDQAIEFENSHDFYKTLTKMLNVHSVDC